MALQTEPERRYQTAEALHDDLLRYLSRKPVLAARLAAVFIGRRKFLARHRVVAAAAAVAVVTLCTTLAFALVQARIASQGARSRSSLGDAQIRLSLIPRTMLITEAAEADKPVTISDMLNRGEALALAETSGDPESRAAVLRMLHAQVICLERPTTDRASVAACLKARSMGERLLDNAIAQSAQSLKP
jgi:serine/threonine-protein kinase